MLKSSTKFVNCKSSKLWRLKVNFSTIHTRLSHSRNLTFVYRLRCVWTVIVWGLKVLEQRARDCAGVYKQECWTRAHSSGAVWESRWTSWAVRPNEPSDFRGRKDLLNHASALVSACPCQPTSEDIKQHFIREGTVRGGGVEREGQRDQGVKGEGGVERRKAREAGPHCCWFFISNSFISPINNSIECNIPLRWLK